MRRRLLSIIEILVFHSISNFHSQSKFLINNLHKILLSATCQQSMLIDDKTSLVQNEHKDASNFTRCDNTRSDHLSHQSSMTTIDFANRSPNVNGDQESIKSWFCDNKSTIAFQNLSYKVKYKKLPWKSAVEKKILDDISGVLSPGMNAIMGPTGSGKSSLLDALAGRRNPNLLSGRILVDGKPQPKSFRSLSGYVVQDSIIIGALTVRENLAFSAALRMKRSCSNEERKQRVCELIDELGLTDVADSKIGTDLQRGLSGGERKRTSIGMELINDPSNLFLDEPTTGLDAHMAKQVMTTLKNLSRRGRTIVFSIHQPKYSIYKLFDTLTLMCQGQLVYHGLAHEKPLEYFNRFGYVCENHNNPSDFFIDILHQREVVNAQRSKNAPTSSDIDDLDACNDLVDAWKKSDSYNSLRRRINAIEVGSQLSCKTSSIRPTFSSSCWSQLEWLCWRNTLVHLRDPLVPILQLLVYLSFALSMGTVYYGLDTSLEYGVQNRQGFVFFVALQVVFVHAGSMDAFLRERVLFTHESSSGYYRVSTYLVAKLLCEIVPTKVIPVICFMPLCYWMAGLSSSVTTFLYHELLLGLTTLAAALICFLVSASFASFGTANMVVSVVFVSMMIFGGYLVNLESLPSWINWLRYCSILYYCIRGLLSNELSSLEFCSKTNLTNIDKRLDGAFDSTGRVNNTSSCQPGRTFLDDLGLPYKAIWHDFVGQSVICLIFLLLTYMQLLRMKRFK